jgi:hypothetical protein
VDPRIQKLVNDSADDTRRAVEIIRAADPDYGQRLYEGITAIMQDTCDCPLTARLLRIERLLIAAGEDVFGLPEQASRPTPESVHALKQELDLD